MAKDIRSNQGYKKLKEQKAKGNRTINAAMGKYPIAQALSRIIGTCMSYQGVLIK